MEVRKSKSKRRTRSLVCLPRIQFFAELKAPHHKRRKDEALQKEIHKKMTQQGVKVYVLETKEDIDLLLRHLDVGILPKENHFGRL
ncbi:MAG: hypothetical protein K2H85_04295 [Allobaculum sp.]|nr:hypothetical protein [Allobaculum sp.]